MKDLRKQVREQLNVHGNVKLSAAEGGDVGAGSSARPKDMTKSFGETTVVRDFSTRILRGDRVGLIGPNGAGKTTLLKMLIGQLAPDNGTVRLGTNLEMISLDQRRDELKPDWTVCDALTGGRGDQVVINGKARHVASYMKDFLFSSEQMRSPLRVLSGGERARLMLARALAKPSNLLVLDEPTNDLDLETLDLLQELLADYQGTVLLVSHDRDFLDRVVTSTITSDGDGRWIEYAGGYSDMLNQRRGAAPRKAEDKAEKAAPLQKSERRDHRRHRPSAKLSFKEKHALETLPTQIDKLHTEIAALHDKLGRADLYSKDPGAFGTATARLGAAQTELAMAEERWLELEMLREELEAAP